MLEEQDIKKIGDIIEEKVRPIVKAEVSLIVKSEITPMVKAEVQAGENRVIAAVGEMIEQNVLPLIDTLGGRLDKVDSRLDKVDSRLDNIQKTIANLPDKAYLDDKVADPEGRCIIRQKNAEKKGDLLVDFLEEKQVLEDTGSPPASLNSRVSTASHDLGIVCSNV